jgi:hypothetical protein
VQVADVVGRHALGGLGVADEVFRSEGVEPDPAEGGLSPVTRVDAPAGTRSREGPDRRLIRVVRPLTYGSGQGALVFVLLGGCVASGTYVALLGIDGCGKSSMASALRAHLEGGGREVVDAGPTAMYTRARGGGGHPWDALDRIVEEGWRLYLAQPPRQSAVVTSGLLESTPTA